jgi:hypothetical protein
MLEGELEAVAELLIFYGCAAQPTSSAAAEKYISRRVLWVASAQIHRANRGIHRARNNRVPLSKSKVQVQHEPAASPCISFRTPNLYVGPSLFYVRQFIPGDQKHTCIPTDGLDNELHVGRAPYVRTQPRMQFFLIKE